MKSSLQKFSFFKYSKFFSKSRIHKLESFLLNSTLLSPVVVSTICGSLLWIIKLLHVTKYLFHSFITDGLLSTIIVCFMFIPSLTFYFLSIALYVSVLWTTHLSLYAWRKPTKRQRRNKYKNALVSTTFLFLFPILITTLILHHIDKVVQSPTCIYTLCPVPYSTLLVHHLHIICTIQSYTSYTMPIHAFIHLYRTLYLCYTILTHYMYICRLY